MYIHPFFAPPISFDETFQHPWVTKVPPIHICGRVYYVGNLNVASHLIDTGEGLLLIDTPFIQQMPLLIDSIYRLGFRVDDIRWILHTHGHLDHWGCSSYLKGICGCETYMSRVDGEMLLNHPVVGGIQDSTVCRGEVQQMEVLFDEGELDFGGLKVKCVATPGHTDGVMSFFFDTEEDGKMYRVGTYGGTGFNTLTNQEMERLQRPASARQDYMDSLEKVQDMRVDVTLGNHPNQNATFEKYEKKLKNPDGPNPYIDPNEWGRYINTLKKLYAEFLEDIPE
ncbi:MAG: MBL fold metallo-hydrolase [Lachnospiraceae bacterium]|nr:MBL fold metallo-hydrolase [Lachnospiraceae bacterium]